MVNAYPHQNTEENDSWSGQTKSPANQQLQSYMNHLQPHADDDGTHCAATLLPVFASHAWFPVPCDERYKTWLVCHADQGDSPSQQSSVMYCVGQISILAKWCIGHVTLKAEVAQNTECLTFNASAVNLSNAGGAALYLQKLCSLFEQVCDIRHEESIILIDDLTNRSHACIMQLPNVKCVDSDFQCTDLSCIPESKQCNNIQDCPYGEDEDDCSNRSCNMSAVNCQTNCTWPQCKCAATYFQCDSGGCVPGSTVCDFEQNCLDGSDELYCNDLLCPVGQLPCADNRACVDEDILFNGIEDCMDASDEYLQKSKVCPGFQCRDFTCIPSIWLNDGIPDCPYAEDEDDFKLQRAIGTTEWPCQENTLPCRGSVRRCYPQEQHCIYDTDSRRNIYACRNAGHLSSCEEFVCPNMYKCPMSYCVSFSRVCDGVIDCQDSSDENNCPIVSCPGMFRCLQEQVCIHREDVCDGKIHCKLSHDDEKYCNGKVLTGCGSCADFPEQLHMISLLEYTYVRIVSLQNKDIRELVSSTVNTYTSFIVIDFSNNLIAVVPSFSFHCFPYLRYIFLNNNRIQSLDHFAFMHIGQLRILDLSNNILSSLSTSSFKGLHSLSVLDLSNNKLIFVDETFFVETQILNSVMVTDNFICCMIPSHVTCFLEQSMVMSSDFCQDLLFHPTLRYISSVTAGAILLQNGLSIYVLLSNKKNFLILNLSVSDAMFGFYLAIVAGSDFYYRDRFLFYVKLWPSGVPCYIAMLIFFLSFQQSVFSLILISCHTCLLIVFPFKKHEHHKYFVRTLLGIWIVVVVELIIVIYLQNIKLIGVVSSHLFCQSPILATDVIVPFVTSSCLVYMLLILALCTCFLGENIVIRRQENSFTKSQSKEKLKCRMMKKSITAVVINFVSLSSVVVVECMMMTGLHIDEMPLIVLTLSVMSLSKICNPWIFSLKTWAQEKVKDISKPT